MATNAYIRPQTGFQTEHNLYESMVIENIQISGNDVVYIPRTLSDSFDQIFGEDILSSFESYATIEMWLQDFAGYGGESEMLSKFGMEIRDTATFIVSRKRFGEVCTPIAPETRDEALKYRPCEGDLIYSPFSKSLFEIKFVEDEFPGFYQLGKKFVWAIRCELVQLNNETFDTGNTEVDQMFGGKNIDRLNETILDEDGNPLFTEDGGRILAETYEVSKPYDDVIGFGDNFAIKKEFTDIMNFDNKNPFNERF